MCAVELTTDKRAETGVLINDFAIVAATVNGSGSQTANNTLVRALFKMGIPVNGKNLFPSNIYGLADVVYHPPEQRRLHRTPS
jgi:hypothetical protein